MADEEKNKANEEFKRLQNEFVSTEAPVNNVPNKIKEVTVYSKRKYVDELKSQQAKYLADMAKYRQDSTQWTKANRAYLKNLQLHKDSAALYDTNDFLARQAKEKLFANDKEFTESRTAFDNVSTVDELLKKPRSAERKKEIQKFSEGFPLIKKEGDIEWREYGLEKGMKFPRHPEIAADTGADEHLSWTAMQFKKPSDTPPAAPVSPERPVNTKVNYDPKYENLQMRSLWANQAKADTTSRIGVLNPLEYNDATKGFSLGEAAREFPEEIKQKYNIRHVAKQAGIKQ